MAPRGSSARQRQIRVGSFCSGLDGVWQGLEQLGRDHLCRHAFACDLDPDVRSMLMHNFDGLTTANVLGDITKVKTRDIPPCDILSGGFPCQTFSSIGAHAGTDDPRGTVVYYIIKYLERVKPRGFFLENVSGLVSRHRDTFHSILMALRNIKVAGVPYYRVTWRIVNTKEHGVPQSRKRVYIVGVAAHCEARSGHAFQWPAPCKMKPLEKFLEPKVPAGSKLSKRGEVANRAIKGGKVPVKRTLCKSMSSQLSRLTQKIKDKGGKVGKDPYVGDILASQAFGNNLTLNYSPCLTRARCGAGGHYLFNRGRQMMTKEMLRLQGMKASRFSLPKVRGMSERKLRLMVGNAFSVNVVVRILSRLLPAAGLMGPIKDPFGDRSLTEDV